MDCGTFRVQKSLPLFTQIALSMSTVVLSGPPWRTGLVLHAKCLLCLCWVRVQKTFHYMLMPLLIVQERCRLWEAMLAQLRREAGGTELEHSR